MNILGIDPGSRITGFGLITLTSLNLLILVVAVSERRVI